MYNKKLLIVLLMITILSSLFAPFQTKAAESTAETRRATDSGTNQLSDISFNTDMAIVLLLVLLMVVMFIWEPIRLDLIALAIPGLLVILSPWTRISVEEALSGFSNTATITIIFMFILSAGIYRSGLIQILIEKITDITGDSEIKQLGIITGLSSLSAGVINNTAVVALFIPMVKELARRTNKSPSRLLMPLSFGAMMGGMLTLIGTSTNLVASNISSRLINREFTVFEFTQIGFILLAIGIIYLITLGRRLIPARISAKEEITEEYEMGNYLTEVVIKKGSPLIGKTIDEAFSEFDYKQEDIDLVELKKRGQSFVEPLGNKYFDQDDHLIIRTDQNTLLKVLNDQRLQLVPGITVTQEYLEQEDESQKVIEVIIPNDSFMVGQTLSEVNFVERYNSSILAVRRRKELTHTNMEEITFEAGDILLLVAGETTMDRLRHNRNFIVSNELETSGYRTSNIILSLSIMAGVILLAVLDVLPIVISALLGVILMAVTDCLDLNEIYSSVNWEIIFLLAGVIPLGRALEKTGTASYLAANLLAVEKYLSPLFILGLFYLLTVLLTNVISRNASVVFMLPIAVDTAQQLGVDPFPFILAVTFAVGCSFLTPVGNQINLMVYGPGGYRFRDFLVVGGPLQLILTLIVPLLISIFFPL
ncbi:MAG: SLC13 family permease [Bacillota bacterium]